MTIKQKETLKKIGVGALISLGAALATYLQDTIPNVDFGTWQPLVVVVNSVIINLLRKLPLLFV